AVTAATSSPNDAVMRHVIQATRFGRVWVGSDHFASQDAAARWLDCGATTVLVQLSQLIQWLQASAAAADSATASASASPTGASLASLLAAAGPKALSLPRDRLCVAIRVNSAGEHGYSADSLV